MKITISANINAPVAKVWNAWTTPEDICQWNAASDDWHTTESEIDLKVGGRFRSRMEAKDGSAGFDFGGSFTVVEPGARLDYLMDDNRCVTVLFEADGERTQVTETFDAENVHPPEMQRDGWQSILNNFARHVEGKSA
ncbi:MAG: SRPBCC domain-containing protein [Gammaproteobacteria bacterium]|nr:SRPBCC domain-containing protein [Gammaproteobacteria bacterium]